MPLGWSEWLVWSASSLWSDTIFPFFSSSPHFFFQPDTIRNGMMRQSRYDELYGCTDANKTFLESRSDGRIGKKKKKMHRKTTTTKTNSTALGFFFLCFGYTPIRVTCTSQFTWAPFFLKNIIFYERYSPGLQSSGVQVLYITTWIEAIALFIGTCTVQYSMWYLIHVSYHILWSHSIR